MSDKAELSTNVILQYINYVEEHWSDVVDNLPDDKLAKALKFMYTTNDLLHRYCVDWVKVTPYKTIQYIPIEQFGTVMDIKKQIKKCQDINLFLVRTMKTALYLPQLKHPRPHDIIFKIFRFVNRVYERYNLKYLWT